MVGRVIVVLFVASVSVACGGQTIHHPATSFPLTVIARVYVPESRSAEYERHAAELVELVREREPGVGWYSVHRSTDDPRAYLWVESYRDQASLDAHGQTDYFAQYNELLSAMEEGDVEIVFRGRLVH